MLSTVALRAHVASVLEALSLAAAAEIAELLEDELLLLRLETSQRDQEIQELKGNIRLLHGELRAARGPGSRGEEVRGPGSRGEEVRGPGSRREEVRGPGSRGEEVRGPGSRGEEVRGVEVRGPGSRGEEVRGPGSRGEEDRGVEVRGPGSRGEEVRGPGSRGEEVRGPGSRGEEVRGPGSRGEEVRGPGSRREEVRGGDGGRGSTGDERISHEHVHADQVDNKPDSVQPGGEEVRGQAERPGEMLTPCEGNNRQWRSTTHEETARNDFDHLNVSLSSLPGPPLDSGSGGFKPSPSLHELLGYGQSRNAPRRRTAKRLKFEMGYICPYCGKCFERGGHLERHKRIHTGEKPYRCETCGRRFNQKCSLKEHTKIHRRGIQAAPVDVPVVEEKQIPEVKPFDDTPLPEEKSRTTADEVRPQNENVLLPHVQVKSEPVEKEITQPDVQGGNEPPREGGENPDENFSAFERDGRQWRSGSQGQNNTEMSGMEYLSSSAQPVASFPGIARLLPAPGEASCSSFSFPGKPYGELENSLISQTPYGSSDTLLVSSDPGSHGGSEAALNHQQQQQQQQQGRSLSFQIIKPKKSYTCMFCEKIFKRAGHLETHLRIHTGEKPYGCHICGRCFNQKSSLKVHMKTHRDGENPDLLEAHHLMFTVPENHALESVAQLKPDLVTFEDQPASREALGDHTVTVKLESNGGDFPERPDDGTGALDRSELLTSGTEKRREATIQTHCVRSHDIKCELSPAAANEQPGYTCASPFLNDKENKDMMQVGYLASELQDQHGARAVNDNVSASVGTGFEIDMTSLGNHEYHEDSCDGARGNCFICSSCGQSFDTFILFQRHPCKNISI